MECRQEGSVAIRRRRRCGARAAIEAGEAYRQEPPVPELPSPRAALKIELTLDQRCEAASGIGPAGEPGEAV